MEFRDYKVTDLLYSWEDYMSRVPKRGTTQKVWAPSSMGVFKFNVDGAISGKQGPNRIRGVLHDYGRVITSLVFSKGVGVKTLTRLNS